MKAVSLTFCLEVGIYSEPKQREEGVVGATRTEEKSFKKSKSKRKLLSGI